MYLTAKNSPLTGGRTPLSYLPFLSNSQYAIIQTTGVRRLQIRIEVVPELTEDEVIIRCAQVDETILKIQQTIQAQAAEFHLIFYKLNQEFYLPLPSILFFETDDEHVYAHTASDTYRVKERLYELERLLPRSFIRVSKSAIVNCRQVYSITRNLTASSPVQFLNSHKTVYVSRLYYQQLKYRLSEHS